ncbi:MAG: hypothetical protein WCJ14_12860 [Verrucomicrobiota bacterium]
MKTIELNQQEQVVLVDVLERCLADLNHEIHYTDHGEFRQMLRERQVVVSGIIHKLPAEFSHEHAA